MPLALSNTWSPLNIQSLLSFLSLKVSPVPSFAAKRLLGAIQNEPGVGGERWRKAEAKIIEIKKDKLLADGIKEADAVIQAQAFMDDLNYYLTGFRFDPQSGIPAKALVEMCEWIKQGLKTPELKQSMEQALAQVDRMIELASCYNQPISRAQIERMLDSVIAEGGQNPESQAQATPWHSVSDTGSIAGKAGTVVWWNFTDSGQSSLVFWSEEERASLCKAGVYLETPATIRAREANQWRRALQYAGERLLLISPLKMNGKATQLHPLWDEIRHCAVSPTDSEAEKEDKYQRLLWQGKSLNAEPTLSLAGRSIVLQAENKAELQAHEEVIYVGKGVISKPKVLPEWPINMVLDNHQQLTGWIDMLIELDDGFVVIDHKSYSGGNVEEHVKEYAPQLALYRDAVTQATGKPVLQTLIHLPMTAQMVEVELP